MFARRFVVLVVSSAVFGCLVGCSGTDTGTSTDSSKPNQGSSSGGSSGGGGSGDQPAKPSDDGVPSDPSPSTTKKQNGAQCKESADCQSDFCIFQGNGLGMCTTTCDGNIDCDLGHNCVKVSNAPQKVCVPD